MLAGPRRPHHAVSEQHRRRCGFTTAGRLLPHGESRSLKGESPFVCISEGGAVLSPCLAQKNLQNHLCRTLGPHTAYMLATSPRPYQAVREQHNCRCGVTTAGRSRPSGSAVAQGVVVLRKNIRGWIRPLSRPRTLKAESPLVRISEGGAALSPGLAKRNI